MGGGSAATTRRWVSIACETRATALNITGPIKRS
jgi:hypothetical protein